VVRWLSPRVAGSWYEKDNLSEIPNSCLNQRSKSLPLWGRWPCRQAGSDEVFFLVVRFAGFFSGSGSGALSSFAP
jgi:hypothetical protein